MGCRSRPTQLECGQRRLPSAESDGKCRVCLALPEVPASDLPVLIRSRRNATCPVWPSAACTSARCEPVPAFPLLPGPSTHPVWPSAAPAPARCEPAPVRRPAGHLRCALSLKPSPTLPEPRPGDLWPGRDCRREFRQARSRTPPPDSVLAAVGMTDGVWQGGSVMSTLRRGPCRASRRYRGRRNSPCAPPCACCRRRP